MDDTTRVLALALGTYFLIAGIGVVVRRKIIPEFIARFRDDPVVSFMGGVLALWLGIAILSLHWRWDDAVAAGITLIGLVAALKGALLIVLGPRLLVLARPFDESLGLAAVWGVVVAVIGVALLVAGYFG
ncbi:MAG: hypothetical protein RKE49_13390 [Oceanicaulis sp.]